MRHSKKTQALLLLISVLMCAAHIHAAEVILTPTQELSQVWQLMDESYDRASAQVRLDKAAAQVRLVGTNALPILISMLKVKERQNQRTNSNRAIFGFRSLGPTAKPAIPELILLLAHQDYAGNAALALAAIGPDAVPPLMAALTNDNARVRMTAASSLNRLWEHAESAAPLLIANLKDKDVDVAMVTMKALGGIVKDPTPALPALIGYIEHTNVDVRLTAMEAIFGYRTKAKSAAPAIIKAMQDKNESVRRSARAVLPYIDPESAKRLLGPDSLVPTY